MQKRKVDELISHFNRKVSEMSIEQKYKMELLGMISALGFAHEKELGTNLAEVGTDLISRQAAINAIDECYCGGEDSCGEPWIYKETAVEAIQMIEPILPAEPKTGKWVEDKSTGYLVCDQCRDVYINPEWLADGHWNFCPNCGADMREETT